MGTTTCHRWAVIALAAALIYLHAHSSAGARMVSIVLHGTVFGLLLEVVVVLMESDTA